MILFIQYAMILKNDYNQEIIYNDSNHHMMNIVNSNIECLSGFPYNMVPKLKSLNSICLHFMLNDICNLDKCNQCLPPSNLFDDNLNSMIDSWQTQFTRKINERRQEISSKLGNTNTVILMVFNHGYSLFFYNFLCSLQKLDKFDDLKQRLFIVVTDKKSKDMLSNSFEWLMIYYPSWLGNKILSSITNENSIKFGSGAFKQTVALQIMIMSDLINSGYNVLLCDTDIVFNKNPLPYLLSLVRKHDTDIQLISDYKCDTTINSGFIFMISNCKTRIFMDTMVKYVGLTFIDKLGIDDQILWNLLINDQHFRQINVAILDPNKFVNGNQVNLMHQNNNNDYSNFLVFHASWTYDIYDKIEKFYIMNSFNVINKQCLNYIGINNESMLDLIPKLSKRKHKRDAKKEEIQRVQKQQDMFVMLGIFQNDQISSK